MRVPTWLLILIVVAISAFALLIQRGAEFGGADGRAVDAIHELRPGYGPWFVPAWKPPGPETESLLFAVQAALGGGFIGYCIGYLRGRSAAIREGKQ